MKRLRSLWLIFAICLAVVLAAMGSISLTVLRLDRAEADAVRQKDLALAEKDEALRLAAEAHHLAAWEENVRLALWRIDTNLAPLVMQESVRPHVAYRSVVSVGELLGVKGGGATRFVPSPLLGEKPPHMIVYFQLDADGRLTSPQVPRGSDLAAVVPQHVAAQTVADSAEQLKLIAPALDREELLAALPATELEQVAVANLPPPQSQQQREDSLAQQTAPLEQMQRGVAEYRSRQQALAGTANTAIAQNDLQWYNSVILPDVDATAMLMTPLWIDNHLVLARRVVVGKQLFVQGCVLDWPSMEQSLLAAVADLLPDADLAPVDSAPQAEDPYQLAVVPARLAPGVPPPLPVADVASSVTPAAGAPLSSVRLSLAIAWVCVLLAASAVAALLWAVLRLSEHRASFVTAVTHELRTPLTTFQMYAEMLAEDMVTEPAQRRQYLETLRAESGRLVHLVENVLAYARLERGRTNPPAEPMPLNTLIESTAERLAARAAQAGMELVVEGRDTVGDLTVRASTSAVEQVLFNLVDNACKYAAGTDDHRIHLVLRSEGDAVQLAVRDHGSGIAPAMRRRLFQSFSKSAHEAAQTAPGVGLGLALSRRLMRDLGGELALDETVDDGACFVVTLPR